MSYITGNVTNLRMPATIGTINSLGIKPNTEECHTMAIIACGASVITTVVIVALGVVIATPLAPVLESPVIKPAFDYVVPALFGGLVAQTVLKGKKQFLYFLVPLAICLFFCYFTAVNSAYYMLIAIAVSVIIYVMDYKKDKQKERSRAFFLFSYAIMPGFRTRNTASYKHPSAAGDVRTPPYLQDTHGYPAR